MDNHRPRVENRHRGTRPRNHAEDNVFFFIPRFRGDWRPAKPQPIQRPNWNIATVAAITAAVLTHSNSYVCTTLLVATAVCSYMTYKAYPAAPETQAPPDDPPLNPRMYYSNRR